MTTYWNPVRVHLGPKSLDRLPEAVGSRAVALVTTAGTMERLGERIRALLGDRLAAVCTDVQPNPTIASCAEVHERLARTPAEGIVAVGGGSVLDTAKTVAAQREAPTGWLGRHLRDGEPVPDGFSPAPLFAVPTTAGTGSEVTPWGTVWDEGRPVKHSLRHPALYPYAAFVDPELTVSLPQDTTVATALDALSHAMEAVWNHNANPVSDTLAAEAIATIPAALHRVLAGPESLDARADLQTGSVLAGLAFSNTQTALAHSISYPLTAAFGLPHGLACSFTLAEVLRLNATADPARVRLVEEALGAGSPADAAERIYALFADAGVAGLLARYVPDADAVTTVEGGFITPGRAGNNLAAVDDEEARAIAKRAYEAVRG